MGAEGETLEPVGRSDEGLFLVGSPGGHLDLLEALSHRVDLEAARWVTVAGPRAERLRAINGDKVIALPWFERRAMGSSLRNVFVSIWLALRERPRTVICTGAGGVMTFTLAARLLGARLLFIETMARVTDASRTARLLGRLAEVVAVQWPEAKRHHRRAVVCRPLLLSGSDLGDEVPAGPGRGTVAFVGTHSEPFLRLLDAAERAASEGVLPKPVLAQAGAADYESTDMNVVSWVAGEEISRRMAEAAVVVVHGGAGMMSAAIRMGRRPIVFSRRRELGEHVDDHQGQLVSKLAELGLVVVARNRISESDVDEAMRAVEGPDETAGLPSLDDIVVSFLGRGRRTAAGLCS